MTSQRTGIVVFTLLPQMHEQPNLLLLTHYLESGVFGWVGANTTCVKRQPLNKCQPQNCKLLLCRSTHLSKFAMKYNEAFLFCLLIFWKMFFSGLEPKVSFYRRQAQSQPSAQLRKGEEKREREVNTNSAGFDIFQRGGGGQKFFEQS